MKFTISLLFTVITLLGCSENSDDVTELEGSWESTCNIGLGSFNNTSSIKIVITYTADKTSSVLNTYSDSNCSTLSSSEALQQTQLTNPERVAATFSIGKTITTVNSVAVKELNYYNADNTIIPDIYLLQNDKTTLFFGVKCVPSLSLPQLTCSAERPNELDYNNYFTKI